ncbi:MAG: hypothetical protein L0207_03555 [Chlamydiae bacterium]|nr:hypothetical protein [Chlamydiota bacterium]
MNFDFFLKQITIVSFAIFAGRFAEIKTEGFTILAISSHRPHDPKWETRPLQIDEKEELEYALSQPYNYFGCGGQAYIFFSEDQKYVIKFFKQRLFSPSFLDRFRKRKIWQREDKLFRDYSSYKTAFEELKEETAVIFVHLNQTNSLQKKLTIVDPLHITHTIPLDSMNFAVQRKAELVYDRIDRLMREGDLSQAKESIEKVIYLLLARCKKGYHDRDPNIRTNCGFVERQVIKIDIGRLSKKEEMKKPENYRREIIRIAAPFYQWLQKNHPSLLPTLEQVLNKVTKDEKGI